MLAYQIFGEGQPGVPLVFLHGMLGERQNWQRQAKVFSRHYPVITVDLRNHGESAHVEGMSYRQMSDDVLELLQHLSLSRVVVCGHSMGGKVAMVLALQSPALLHRLVVVDIAPVSYPPWHQHLLQTLLALPVASLDSRRELDRLLAVEVEDALERGFLLKNLVRAGQGFRWKCNLPEIARQYLKIAGFPVQQARFTAETLFIRGAESRYITAEHDAVIRQYFPLAQVETIAGAGHLPHVQQAEVFARRLHCFLGDAGSLADMNAGVT